MSNLTSDKEESMGRPSSVHSNGRYQAVIEFDMPTYKPTRRYLREFIKEALEIAGQRRSNKDPLHHGLGQVTVRTIEKKVIW